jgi:phospholipid/cholesterol/gamma-HCH transport system substrate-binding protein
MAEPADKRGSEGQGGFSLLPRSLGVKVGILLGLSIIVAVGFITYVLYARGVFEQTQRLYLIADNAEGVRVGADLSFAGFPIGTVRRIRLRDDGKVRISVRVPVDDAKWLRESSVFVLEVPIVGAAKLRAFTSNLQDPPLPDRAERPVLRGDTAQEIPKLVAAARNILESLEELVQAGSSLQQSIANARTVSERMAGKQGLLAAALGSEENAKKVITAIDNTNAVLARLDSVLAKADQRVLSQGGLVDETQKAVVQANAILGEVRASLKRVDGILADAQVVAGNAKAATADLGALRAEVEASLRKVSALIDEINRKWPFERDTKIKLP